MKIGTLLTTLNKSSRISQGSQNVIARSVSGCEAKPKQTESLSLTIEKYNGLDGSSDSSLHSEQAPQSLK